MHDSFARVFGQGYGGPHYVDCNGVHVAVSEWVGQSVSVLSYADGSLVHRFGSKLVRSPRGVKLLADGSGVIVADYHNHRVVLLSLVDNLLGSAPLAVGRLEAPCEHRAVCCARWRRRGDRSLLWSNGGPHPLDEDWLPQWRAGEC